VRVAIRTFGCRLNRAESDAVESALLAAGHDVIDAIEHADAVLVNTCTITAEADADARAYIARVARQRADRRIVVSGCWATAAAAEAGALPGVAAVVPHERARELPATIAALAGAPDVVPAALARRGPLASARPTLARGRARALLAVQDGCDYRCSFCIVPKVRGTSRSSELADVLTRVDALVAASVPELVMTGVHLGTWGRDLRPRRRLVDLVAAIVPRLGGARLRLSSIDPHEVDDDLVDLFASSPGALCRHLHLPVQSGDTAVLRRMRRAHTAETFATLVERLTMRVPGVAIGSDVIVGHPGEDEASFERTRALLEALPIAYLHVFRYSVREGTAAASWRDRADPREAARRSAVLRALSDDKRAALRRSIAECELDAIVHVGAAKDGTFVAIADNDLDLRLSGAVGSPFAGRRVRVRVGADGLHAQPVP
jgi:threonylcarbamoyladenosine tRNA methylthiotransferase MtaB